MMFGDERDKIKEEVEAVLEVMSADDILLDNDMDMAQALAILIDEGYIVLPEAKAVR
jgi:thiazole synthase ThiGH ThiG subunit